MGNISGGSSSDPVNFKLVSNPEIALNFDGIAGPNGTDGTPTIKTWKVTPRAGYLLPDTNRTGLESTIFAVVNLYYQIKATLVNTDGNIYRLAWEISVDNGVTWSSQIINNQSSISSVLGNWEAWSANFIFLEIPITIASYPTPTLFRLVFQTNNPTVDPGVSVREILLLATMMMPDGWSIEEV